MKHNNFDGICKRAENVPSRIAPFIYALAACYPAIRSLWLIGRQPNPRSEHDAARTDSGPWELVAFANRHTLNGLNASTGLHREDVRLSVVTDGNRFEHAWGSIRDHGSLTQWDWIEANPDEAFYSEAASPRPNPAARFDRARRKAVCLWRCPLTP